MNTLFDREVTIITPCFCAGADQDMAEIRAPAIRGEWRWWFRVLGGTESDERSVFGGIAKNGASREEESSTSSKVVVRVQMTARGEHIGNLMPRDTTAPLAYLLHFVKASSRGKRLEANGMLAPGTKFRLLVLERTPLPPRLAQMAMTALESMLCFGAIGYRSRRACGALSAADMSFQDFQLRAAALVHKNVSVAWLTDHTGPILTTWEGAMKDLGTALKELRKDGYSAGKAGDTLTPFGCAGNKARHLDRQASGVRLRPIQLNRGVLPAIVFTDHELHPSCRVKGFSLIGRHLSSGILAGPS